MAESELDKSQKVKCKLMAIIYTNQSSGVFVGKEKKTYEKLFRGLINISSI